MPATSPEAKARHAAYLRDLYRWYRDHGICTYCKAQWSAPGKTYCESCAKKAKARADKRDPGREQRRLYNQARRERLKNAGRCIECGAQALEGRTRCRDCTKKKNESEEVRRIRKRIERKEAKKRDGLQ